MNDRPIKAQEDINKIRRILKIRGFNDLADLLIDSTSYVNQSNQFGSLWYSVISQFEIYSPEKQHKELVKLSNQRKSEILNCIYILYPIVEEAPEITEVVFFKQ